MAPANLDVLIQAAGSEMEAEREEMISSAKLLSRRLDSLIDQNGPRMRMELPTILSLLIRMRDSIESFRTAERVHLALFDAGLDQPAATP